MGLPSWFWVHYPTRFFHLTRLAFKLRYVKPKDVTRVLSFLSSTPALAELMIQFRIEGPLPEWHEFEEVAPTLVLPGLPTLSCSLLNHIHLTGHHACTLTLLYHLRPGPTCQVELTEDKEKRNVDILARFLQRHPFGQNVVAALVSSGSEMDNDIGWKLQSTSVCSPAGSVVLRFKLDSEHSEAIVGAISWDSLQDLNLNLRDEMYAVAAYVVQSVRNSRSLASVTVLGHHSTRWLCYSLLPNIATETTPMPFPALSRVILCSVDMSRLKCVDREGGVVLHAAKERADKHGYYLKDVVLRQCIFSASAARITSSYSSRTSQSLSRATSRWMEHDSNACCITMRHRASSCGCIA
jgi:hypothetical protein